jgi:hypothetical protein
MRIAPGPVLAVLLVLSVALPGRAQTAPSYEVIVNSPKQLEIRFHGLAVRSVQADDNQNALGIDFLQPVDGTLFERLPGELPLWIAMAYANFDDGVIHTVRPATFLVRPESDGFVLRLIARERAGSSTAQAEPAPLRGSFDAP